MLGDKEHRLAFGFYILRRQWAKIEGALQSDNNFV